MLEKIVRERRASLAPNPAQLNAGPHILVSEPSVGDMEEHMFYGLPRRASTQSMGPVAVPLVGWRTYALVYFSVLLF